MAFMATFGVPLSSTSFQMKFFCLMEWCLSQNEYGESIQILRKLISIHSHVHVTHACMATQSLGKASITILLSANLNLKSENFVSEPHYLTHHTSSVSPSRNQKNLWVRSLGLLFMLSGVKGAAPRKCIDVPFSRNYVLTWVFDHIKSYNGGFEIQLVLDKCTGTITVFYLSSQNSDMMK
ncbi:Xyloglucan endotransglucosylase/hydrolase protein 4 [Vitis vinifera]|uniref:Xyloglucan endotransglucosylase/hydrolase protein 4 n=1 Tax=Vitis vinifera TaxID=29760 RepID=A0A438FTK1_VITVI|nr:Xyloglucan endotransglucosylase/hydrolase protein 4 [Vitis vinifera]